MRKYPLEREASEIDPIYVCRIFGGVRGRRRINKSKNCAAVHIDCDKLRMVADRSRDGSAGRFWLRAGDVRADHSNRKRQSKSSLPMQMVK